MTANFDFANREIENLTGYDILIEKPKDLSFIISGSAAQPTYTGSVLFKSKGRIGLAVRCEARKKPDHSASCGVRMVEEDQFSPGSVELHLPDESGTQTLNKLITSPNKLYIVPGDVASVLLATHPFNAVSTSPPTYIAVPADLKMPVTFGEPALAKSLYIYRVHI